MMTLQVVTIHPTLQSASRRVRRTIVKKSIRKLKKKLYPREKLDKEGSFCNFDEEDEEE